MAISKFKKRYNVSLTPQIVDRFQSLVREIGLPQSTMSTAIDDFLKDMCEVFQTAKDQGSMQISDIFKVMGKQVELVLEDERQKNQQMKGEINAGKTKGKGQHVPVLS